MRMMTLTALCAALALSPASAVMQAQEPGAPVQREQEKATELSGKVKSVDASANIIKLEGVSEDIVVTANTKFGEGLSLASLKEGMSVVISGKAMADGRIEALEVKSA